MLWLIPNLPVSGQEAYSQAEGKLPVKQKEIWATGVGAGINSPIPAPPLVSRGSSQHTLPFPPPPMTPSTLLTNIQKCTDSGLRTLRGHVVGRCVFVHEHCKILRGKFNMTLKWLIIHTFLYTLSSINKGWETSPGKIHGSPSSWWRDGGGSITGNEITSIK